MLVAGFKAQTAQAECAGFSFERGEELAGISPAARFGTDIHAFDFSDPRLKLKDAAAGDGCLAEVADQEGKVPLAKAVGGKRKTVLRRVNLQKVTFGLSDQQLRVLADGGIHLA